MPKAHEEEVTGHRLGVRGSKVSAGSGGRRALQMVYQCQMGGLPRTRHHHVLYDLACILARRYGKGLG